MGINLGLDIGAIGLKFAALGTRADRTILEALCSAHPEFRLTDLHGAPLVLSDYRRLAGRCSVFAKSDMIHAQQKGYSPAEILRGLCDAVARNFKSAIVKGRPVETPIALIGGVTQNAGVTNALREAFGVTAEQLFVPEH